MKTTQQVMMANPWMTYGFAVGFVSGLSAQARLNQFAGLSPDEWRKASDDYAQGYRHSFDRKAS